jgi:hypothetical protein
MLNVVVLSVAMSRVVEHRNRPNARLELTFEQAILTDGEGLVQLTSSLRLLVA